MDNKEITTDQQAELMRSYRDILALKELLEAVLGHLVNEAISEPVPAFDLDRLQAMFDAEAEGN